MQRIRPFKLLAGAALMAVGLIGLSMLSQGVAALLLVLAVGFFNSIMFPTIFTLAIEDLGEGKPQGSGCCTAIVGGAFIPPAMGAVVDSAGFGWLSSCPWCATCTSHGMLDVWCLRCRLEGADIAKFP